MLPLVLIVIVRAQLPPRFPDVHLATDLLEGRLVRIVCVWWRRRESNPRPKTFIRSLYMRVRIPFSSLSAVRNRQKPDESYPLNFAERARRPFD